MPTTATVQTKDIIANPHCKRCWGKGYAYITANHERRAVMCGCARAVKQTVRAAE